MTTPRLPAVFAFALASLGAFSVSCTAILAPRDDVQRCGTADDCDDTGDNRYAPVCKFDDDNLDLDSSRVDKICVADFKADVGCNPASITDLEHPFRATFDALSKPERYTACDPATQLGTRGCLPMTGTCAEGLSVNAVGLCDDNDPDTPMVVVFDPELAGQDIRDQFCRSFFCDDRFVCNDSSDKCVQCNPELEFGEGGCGEVWISGAPSCVYGTNECEGADVTNETVSYGACGA